MLKFDITKKQGLARVGVIHTEHGDIKTPAFVGAATKATVKALTMKEMNALGSQAILANTYHLILQPGTELIKEVGGLATFNSWHKPTFTDSGGFQIFSLPDVKITEEGVRFRSYLSGDKFELTPEGSMKAQWDIGADIHMAFDHLAKSESYDDMKEAMERTHRWLTRCVEEHDKLAARVTSCEIEHAKLKTRRVTPVEGIPRSSQALAPRGRRGRDNGRQDPPHMQYLYAVVQGGTFLDLRAKSAKFCNSVNPDGFGIGGVFTADGMAEMLQTVCPLLEENKPRHLLGMGQEPRDLFIGAENGCDTFDCVGPTRMARNGTLYTLDGRINIKNAKYTHDFTPVMSECDCECCKNYNKAYLHHLFKADEITAKVLASIHNEHFVVTVVDKIRAAIANDTFEEYKNTFLNRYYH